MQSPFIILIMGIAGAGKTTIGRELASALGWRFCDGDAFHSAAHIEQLRRGIPLTDEDRQLWLLDIHQAIGEWVDRREQVVLACSVLKAAYRELVLAGHTEYVRLVYLKADPELLRQRLIERKGHFMGQALLASQLAILEEPADALVIDATEPPSSIIEQVRSAFNV
jgi:gluconokinase